MTTTVLTDSQTRRVIEYYKAGVMVRSLKKRFHISEKTLYRIVDAAGVPRRGHRQKWEIRKP